MTTTRRKLTALDRAQEDLAAAEKRQAKAKTRADKAAAEDQAAKAELDTARREVKAYRGLVTSLTPQPEQTPTSKEPTE